MQGDNQRFLLDVPSSVSSRDTGSRAASTRSGEAPTITLAALKERIAAIEDEVNAGDGSEKYRDCIYYKYKWEREVRWTLDRLGGKYYYIPHNRDIASGLPAGSDVHTDKFANSTIREYGETDPGDLGEHRIVGRDENLFSVRWPGVVFSVRPLLAGEYKYYFGYLPEESVVCDGIPEQEMQRQEVFVHVTAPAGTLHEAFFDPTAIGAAVGADTTNGALTPTALTVEGTATTVQSLNWQNGVVTLELSPAASLSGYDIDVIALDGSVTLTLAFDAAVAGDNSGVLTWAVATQPWHAGDQLMLRIREAG